MPLLPRAKATLHSGPAWWLVFCAPHSRGASFLGDGIDFEDYCDDVFDFAGEHGAGGVSASDLSSGLLAVFA